MVRLTIIDFFMCRSENSMLFMLKEGKLPHSQTESLDIPDIRSKFYSSWLVVFDKLILLINVNVVIAFKVLAANITKEQERLAKLHKLDWYVW